jgi:hypothetical protein
MSLITKTGSQALLIPMAKSLEPMNGPTIVGEKQDSGRDVPLKQAVRPNAERAYGLRHRYHFW